MAVFRASCALLSVLLVAACGDGGSSGGTDASDGLDGTGGDTSGDIVVSDTAVVDTSAIDTSDGPVLTTGALPATILCAGSLVEVPYVLAADPGESYEIDVELSDAVGDFGSAERMGSFDVLPGAGTVLAELDDDVEPGTGYRIRVVLRSPRVVADDSGQDLEVQGEVDIDLTVTPRVALPGDTVRFVDGTVGVTARTWTFPDDANVATSTDLAVDVTFAEVGHKQARYRGTAASGCVATYLVDAPRIVSCSPAIPAEAEVITTVEDERRTGGGYSAWMCGGSLASGFGGVPTLFLEPGAEFEFEGGGSYTVYVKAGATFRGGNGGTAQVIREPGALIVDHSNQVTIDCPSLTFDRSAAPTDGCVPAGTDPDAVTVTTGAIAAGPHCPGAELAVPVTVAGTLGAGNLLVPQLSDAQGSFDAAINLAPVAASASGTIDVTLPRAVPAGDGYRLRMISSMPPSIGPPSATFAVPQASVASFDRPSRKTLVGAEVTFTNTSPDFESATWTFGDGASPATSTAGDGVTTYTTPGWKTVSLAITDAQGCTSTATLERDEDVFDSGFEVLSCEIAVPADADVLEPGLHDLFSPQNPVWACGGAVVALSAGDRLAIVEENGRLEFGGGGVHTFYVRAGGQFIGSPGGLTTVVYETGAELLRTEQLADVLECPTLTVDTSSAPSPGCAPWTPPTPALTIGEPEKTAFCHEDGVAVPFTATGLFPLGSEIRLELSDAFGGFSSPIVVGTTDTLADGVVYGRIRADSVPPGSGYRVRVASDDPALVSAPAATSISVQDTPVIDIEQVFFAAEGEPFSFVNDTEGELTWVWTIDDVEFSTERDPTFTLTEHRTYEIEVVASTSAGCEDDLTIPMKVYSCDPPVAPTTTILTSQEPEIFGGLHRYWLCDGGELRVGAGDGVFYVEDGGVLDVYSGGIFVSYIKAGGTYTGEASGLRAVVYEPGADVTLSGRENVVLECPSLTFDTTLAPANSCP